MSVFLHLTSFARYSSWLIIHYRGNLLQYVRMSFRARTPFVPVDMHNFMGCVMSFRATGWMLAIIHLIYFFLFTFPIQYASALVTISGVAESSPFLIFLSLWSYHNRYYTQSLDLSFSGFLTSLILY